MNWANQDGQLQAETHVGSFVIEKLTTDGKYGLYCPGDMPEMDEPFETGTEDECKVLAEHVFENLSALRHAMPEARTARE